MTSETHRNLDGIVLARLLVQPESFSVAALAGSLAALMTLEKPQARKIAEAALVRLKEQGFIWPDTKLKLTDEGEAAALRALGYSSLPTQQTTSWDWAKKALIGRKLPNVPKTALVDAGKSDKVALWIVAEKHGIKPPKNQDLTASMVLRILAWRTLDLPDSGPFSKNSGIGALLGLAGIAPEESETQSPAPRKPAREKTARKKATRKPIEKPEKEPVRTSAQPITTIEGIVAFADKVNQIALTTKEGRWLGHKVFIAQVWKELARRPGTEMSLEHFKKRLVQAARGGHVALSRADLIGVLPQEEVRSSETEYGDETFHFVETEHLG